MNGLFGDNVRSRRLNGIVYSFKQKPPLPPWGSRLSCQVRRGGGRVVVGGRGGAIIKRKLILPSGLKATGDKVKPPLHGSSDQMADLLGAHGIDSGR